MNIFCDTTSAECNKSKLAFNDIIKVNLYITLISNVGFCNIYRNKIRYFDHFLKMQAKTREKFSDSKFHKTPKCTVIKYDSRSPSVRFEQRFVLDHTEKFSSAILQACLVTSVNVVL